MGSADHVGKKIVDQPGRDDVAPAPRLGGQVAEKERVHRPLQANVKLTNFALRQRDYLNTSKGEPLVDTCDVLLVPIIL